RKGDLPARRRAVPRGTPGLQREESVREAGRRGLLHGCYPVHAGEGVGGGGGSEERGRRAFAKPRRRAGEVAGGWIQEDQVLHERKRGSGKVGASRKRDAYDVLLDHVGAAAAGIAFLQCERAAARNVRTTARAGVGRDAAADVRRAGIRNGDRRKAPGGGRKRRRVCSDENGRRYGQRRQRIFCAKSLSVRRVSRRNRLFRAPFPGT